MSTKELLEDATETYERGEWKEAKAKLDEFFKEVTDDPSSNGIKAEGHVLMARILTMQTKFRNAIGHCEKAIRISEGENDRKAEADALRWLGHIRWKKGDYKGALKDHEKGLGIAKDLGDQRLVGILHIETAMVHSMTGDLSRAEHDYREAILALQPTGERRQLSRAYNNLGDNFMGRGKYDKALDILEKAKTIADQANAKDMYAFAAFNKAESYFELGKYEEALAELDISLPVLEEIGDTYGESGANQIYGLVYAKLGEWQKAETHLLKARRLAQRNSMPVSEAKVIRDIGRVYKWRGDHDKAKLYFLEAKEIFEKHGADGEVHKMKEDLEGLD